MKIFAALVLLICSLALPSYGESLSPASTSSEKLPYEDLPPGGLFSSIVTAHGQEMIMGSYRSFEIVPINPSSTFTEDVPEIFVVFHTHQHDSEFRVSGQWLVEHAEGLPSNFTLGTDSMILMTEDESGYVSIKRPSKGWPLGQYKVQIFTGTGESDMSPIGSLRFKVVQSKAAS